MTTPRLKIFSSLENNIAIMAACIPTLKPLGKLVSSSIHSLRSRSGRNDGYFNHIEDAHHLPKLQPFKQPHTERKTLQSPIGNRAEVHGPERHGLTKSDRSSFSEQHLNQIKTKKAFQVTDEVYRPTMRSYGDEGRLVRNPMPFD